ncbi:MAG TPA: XrtB/PEP-CTERM-associated transcriptional regulator EpsA [Burkholderiales bacterium]|nr:XrtB/PEP-CTERM-associated transcriptional regulator EpsA [Burkholderiales bacterium]
MGNEALFFGGRDAEMMLANSETAIEIRTRAKFFSWVQGTFQSVLAHEVLVCGLAHASSRRLKFEWFGSFPLAEKKFAELCRPDGGLLHSLVRMWQQGGWSTVRLGAAPEIGSPPETERLLNEIREFDLSNALADGFAGPDGQPCSFFVFFKMPTLPCARTAHVLQIWLPYLYAAWLRVVSEEAALAEPHARRIRGVLTAREVEILNWVGKGKTNGDIARVLGIGEATVATHLERIFRKLGVRTRAAAVAKGMALNLEQGAGPGWRYY